MGVAWRSRRTMHVLTYPLILKYFFDIPALFCSLALHFGAGKVTLTIINNQGSSALRSALNNVRKLAFKTFFQLPIIYIIIQLLV